MGGRVDGVAWSRCGRRRTGRAGREGRVGGREAGAVAAAAGDLGRAAGPERAGSATPAEGGAVAVVGAGEAGRVEGGVAPPLEASGPQARSRVPLGWVPWPGMAWHSVQAMAPRSEPAFRWAWWAPTPGEVVAVLPVVSLGGAAGEVGIERGGDPGRVAVAGGAGQRAHVDPAVHVGRGVDGGRGVAGVAGGAVGALGVRRGGRDAVAGAAGEAAGLVQVGA